MTHGYINSHVTAGKRKKIRKGRTENFFDMLIKVVENLLFSGKMVDVRFTVENTELSGVGSVPRLYASNHE